MQRLPTLTFIQRKRVQSFPLFFEQVCACLLRLTAALFQLGFYLYSQVRIIYILKFSGVITEIVS